MPDVLVIGAAHLDFYGDFAADQEGFVDKVGDISIQVGGTACNVAVMLVRNNVTASLLTVLPEDSITTPVILGHLHRSGVNTDYVSRQPGLPEGGLVAHRLNGALVSAVSHSAMESVSLHSSQLQIAVRDHRLVAVDCNLAGDSLADIARLAADIDRPLCVAGVSEPKIARIYSMTAATNVRLAILTMNAREATACFGIADNQPDAKTARDVCSRAHAERVLITRGSEGAWGLTANGETVRLTAPAVSRIATTTGAGDAAFAALCATLCEASHFGWLAAGDMIRDYVSQSLRADAPTPD